MSGVTVGITPLGKPRMTQRDKWAKRPAVVRYHAFCDGLRLLMPHKLPDELVMEFYIPMPKSWSKNKRAFMNRQPHQQKPDIDNLCKAVMDALSKDDSYIYSLGAKKYWSDDPVGGIRFLNMEGR